MTNYNKDADKPMYFGSKKDEDKSSTGSDDLINDLLGGGCTWEDDDDAENENAAEKETSKSENDSKNESESDKSSNEEISKKDVNNSNENKKIIIKNLSVPKNDKKDENLLDIKTSAKEGSGSDSKIYEISVGIIIPSNNWTQIISSEKIKAKFEKVLNQLSRMIKNRDVSFKSKDGTYIFNNCSKVLFVDTASSDGTWESIVNISGSEEDGIYTGIRLTKDPGYEKAVTAGISWLAEKNFDYIIVMDIYSFMEGLESINKLLSGLVAGNDIVYGKGAEKEEPKKKKKKISKKETEPARNVSVFACSGRVANMLTYVNPYSTDLYVFLSRLAYVHTFVDIKCDVVPQKKAENFLKKESCTFGCIAALCLLLFFIFPDIIPALTLCGVLCVAVLLFKTLNASEEIRKTLRQIPEYAIDKITVEK